VASRSPALNLNAAGGDQGFETVLLGDHLTLIADPDRHGVEPAQVT